MYTNNDLSKVISNHSSIFDQDRPNPSHKRLSDKEFLIYYSNSHFFLNDEEAVLEILNEFKIDPEVAYTQGDFAFYIAYKKPFIKTQSDSWIQTNLLETHLELYLDSGEIYTTKIDTDIYWYALTAPNDIIANETEERKYTKESQSSNGKYLLYTDNNGFKRCDEVIAGYFVQKTGSTDKVSRVVTKDGSIYEIKGDKLLYTGGVRQKFLAKINAQTVFKADGNTYEGQPLSECRKWLKGREFKGTDVNFESMGICL